MKKIYTTPSLISIHRLQAGRTKFLIKKRIYWHSCSLCHLCRAVFVEDVLVNSSIMERWNIGIPGADCGVPLSLTGWKKQP